VTLGKGNVVLPDITAGNGVIHVLDEVLFPRFGEEEQPPVESVQHRFGVESAVRKSGANLFADALVETGMDKIIDDRVIEDVFIAYLAY